MSCPNVLFIVSPIGLWMNSYRLRRYTWDYRRGLGGHKLRNDWAGYVNSLVLHWVPNLSNKLTQRSLVSHQIIPNGKCKFDHQCLRKFGENSGSSSFGNLKWYQIAPRIFLVFRGTPVKTRTGSFERRDGMQFSVMMVHVYAKEA